jgi:Flp pilus assembly pilin Flp
LRDDRGVTSLEAVLILGVISLPLLMFLSSLGTRFIMWMRDQAPNIFDEAATFTM